MYHQITTHTLSQMYDINFIQYHSKRNPQYSKSYLTEKKQLLNIKPSKSNIFTNLNNI